MKKHRRLPVFLFAAMFACLLVFSACSSAASSTTAAYSAPAAEEYSSAAGTEADAKLSGNGNTSVLQPQDDRKIILNADIYMEATDFDATTAALEKAIGAAGGYVSASSSSAAGTNYGRSANITARIPAESYSSFLNAAAGTGNITSKNETSEDITAQYVDVEARLTALRAQEARLIELGQQAATVEDLITIHQQLSEVQYQIESYTATQRTYDNLIAYSTVTLSVTEVEKETPAPATGYGARLINAFKNSWLVAFNFVKELGIFLVSILPLLVFAGIIALVVILLAKKGSHKRKPPAPPSMNTPPNNLPGPPPPLS
ncbi:MAG: DUF4349 domain-containing protein [Oscillospiraceae bacterium]